MTRSLLFSVAALCALLTACQAPRSAAEVPLVVFATDGDGGRLHHVQRADASEPPRPLAVPAGAGNVRVASRAAAFAATVGGAGGSAELQVFTAGERGFTAKVLAREWAWDFAWHESGDAIAWIAGRERRELFVARPPAWAATRVPFPEGVPAEPRWLDAQRLLVVRRAGARSELVVLDVMSGVAAVVYRASGDATLSDASPVPGSTDVLVVEASPDAAPGRLLRVALAGGEATTLATGFFLPGTVAVSPNGRFIATVSSPDLGALQRREAGLRWVGAAWPSAPADASGVTALGWSPDGRQLVLARQRDGRRWVEVYTEGDREARPRALGFEAAPGFAPQWWQPRRGHFQP